jgi:broad specificity phosphatase PhoE
MTLLTLRYQEEQKKMSKTRHRFQEEAKHRRDRLPRLVILVRHGESEGNADHTLYRTKPDNLVELTSKGIHQSQEAGKRIEEIFKRADQNRKYKDAAIKRVHLVISPFERTLQTAAALRPCFEHRIVRTDVQPRIREQEFGNLQGHDFEDFRKSQKTVGRFWYRFPTGESGADVYDRVRSWWFDFVLNINERVGFEPIDALVIVTHGLTMRFLLMQLYDWSPTTFHSVWNADNCDLNILEKDLGKPGLSPYVLDEENGDMPKSSIDLIVELKSQPGKKQNYRLNDYLRIPRPRTTRLEIVKKQLAAQYPEIYVDDIESIMFMPFIDGANIQGRTSCGKRAALSFLQVNDRQDLQAFPNL